MKVPGNISAMQMKERNRKTDGYQKLLRLIKQESDGDKILFF